MTKPSASGHCSPKRNSAGQSLVARWARDERGATAIEYSIIISSVFLTMVTSLYAFGDQLKVMFDFVGDTISAALK